MCTQVSVIKRKLNSGKTGLYLKYYEEGKTYLSSLSMVYSKSDSKEYKSALMELAEVKRAEEQLRMLAKGTIIEKRNIAEEIEKLKCISNNLNKEIEYKEEKKAKLKEEIENKRKELNELIKMDLSKKLDVLNSNVVESYKPIPKPLEIAKKLFNDEAIPKCSGVYFIWDASKVVYVGKADKLSNRLNKSHYKIGAHNFISYLHYPLDVLRWAESYYIGLLKPERNFAPGTWNNLEDYKD